MTSSRMVLAGILSAGLFSGCSGGGGGDDSSAQVPVNPLMITGTNGEQVAAEVVDKTADIADSGGVSQDFGISSNINSSDVVSFKDRILYLGLNKYALGSTSQFNTAAFSVEDSCEGGGKAMISFTGANNSTPIEGDTLSVILTNCVEGDEVLNGSIAITFNVLEGDVENQVSPWRIELGVQANNFSAKEGSETHSINGAFTLSTSLQGGINRFEMSGSDLIFTEGSGVARLTNFSFIGTEDSAIPANYTTEYNFVYAGSDIGGVVTVTTIVPFAGLGENPPDSGELKIEGESGSSIVVEANNGQATITIDENPDDPADDVVITGPWDSFFDE